MANADKIEELWALSAENKHAEALAEAGRWSIALTACSFFSSDQESVRQSGPAFVSLIANSGLQCGDFAGLSILLRELSEVRRKSVELDDSTHHLRRMMHAFLERQYYDDAEDTDLPELATLANLLAQRATGLPKPG